MDSAALNSEVLNGSAFVERRVLLPDAAFGAVFALTEVQLQVLSGATVSQYEILGDLQRLSLIPDAAAVVDTVATASIDVFKVAYIGNASTGTEFRLFGDIARFREVSLGAASTGAQFGTTAVLSRVRQLSGSVAVNATVTASLSKLVQVGTAAATAQALLTDNGLRTFRFMEGTAVAQFEVSGSATRQQTMRGATLLTHGLEGNLTKSARFDLGPVTVSTEFSAAANLSNKMRLVGSASAGFNLLGSLNNNAEAMDVPERTMFRPAETTEMVA